MRPMLPLCLWLAITPAMAQTAYKCVGPQGRVSYQDRPCPAGQHGRKVRLLVPPVAASPRAPAEAPPAPEPGPPPEPPAAPAPATESLPQLYACVRATDGSRYVSEDGDPPPYAVPLGMLDAGGALSEAYGATRGRAGISAPEANRGRVTAGMIANDYVQVQDACEPMDVEAICETLAQQREGNDRQLRQAFRSQRAPLERRQRTLDAQLANCPGG